MSVLALRALRGSRPFAVVFRLWVVLVAGLVACGGDNLTLPDDGQPTKITVVEGDGQTGPTGSVLAQMLTVLVTDARNRPVANQPVVFSFPEGANPGSLSLDTAVTDVDGRASTEWMLGPAAGSQQVRAAVLLDGVVSPSLVVSFSATAASSAAARLESVAGNNQQGAVGSALPDSLVVRVVDEFGNAVAGTTVRWTVVAGGGVVEPATVVTGSDGRAAAQRVSGAGAGTQRTQAAVTGLSGSPVAFQHTARAANPARLLRVSGDGNQAPAGSQLAEPLVVRLVDANDNGIGGRTVTWEVGARSGTVTPVNATTDAEGYASTRWTLSTTVGTNMVNAKFPNLPSVPFTATGTPDVPKNILLDGGNNQTGTAGTALGTPLSVKITDAQNVPIAGVAVTWTAQGGGLVDGETSTITATDANGIARVTRTLGNQPKAYTTTAARTGLTGSPVSFTSTATVGAAAKLELTTQPSAAASSGAVFAQQPVVQLRDAVGNNVPQAGVSITASVSGGVQLNGTRTVQTDANGRAAFTGLAIAAAAGSYTLTFTPTSASLTAATSNTIQLAAGAPAKLVLVTPPSAGTASGQTFAQQPVVEVQDATGNAVGGAGRTVTVELASGPGTLGGTVSTTTNGSHRAVFTNLRITGTAGAHTLRFKSSGLTEVVSGTITVGAGGASQIAAQGGDNQTAVAGGVVSPPPSVLVRDAGGNPVAGVQVTFAVASGGGTIDDATPTTNASGIATLGSWRLGPTAGTNTVRATVAGLAGSPVTFTATGLAGPAAKLAIITQPSASVSNGQTFPQQPVVEVQDANGNAVKAAGRSVTAAIASGGGTLNGTASVQTDANGRASFTNLGITGEAGSRTLQFSSTDVTAATSNGVSVGAGAASQLEVLSGNNQTATVNTVLPTDPSVIVRDASNNPVSGVSVTFAVASGGGSITGATQTTNAAGIATVGSWRLGDGVGLNTLTAIATSLGGSSVTFSATATAGAAAKLVMIAQPSASVILGQAFPQQPVVEVQDAAGNPIAVAGRTVTAAIANGGGTLDGTESVTTDANGRATFTNLSISGNSGSRTLRFTSGTLTGVTSSAIAVGAGSATQIAVQGGNNQTAAVDAVLPTAPSVLVRDAGGNPVAGIQVTFAVASGDGGITGATSMTNAAGIATVGSWRLGSAVGTNTLTATAPGLTGSPVTFTATAIAGAATKLAIVTQPSGTATSGEALAQQPVVEVQDADGNPITTAGRTVTAAIAGGGGGTLSGTTSVTTDANGHATFTNLAISGAAGSRALRFTSAGLTAVNSSSIAVGAGAATEIEAQGGDDQTAAVNAVLPTDPSVIVRDAGGNPVAGVQVTFAVASGDGSITGPTPLTNAAGVATVGSWRLGPAAGTNTLTATVAGLSGSPVTFTATATAAGTTTALSSSDNTTIIGTLVTFTATITNGGSTPTGSVRWLINGDEVATTPLAGGQATYATSSLLAGSHSIRAQYLGDGSHTPSQSSLVTQTVAKAATTTTITSDTPEPSSVLETVTVSFTVTSGFGTPTGNVTVTANGGLESCTASVAAGSCDLVLALPGNRTLTATYEGDDAHAGSSGSESHQVMLLNSPPDANGDTYTMTQGGTLTVNEADGVRQNDSDPENAPLTAVLVAGPAQDPAFTLNDDGSFSYTPPADFVGSDSFTYRVSDGSAQSSVATVTITVNAAEATP